MIKYHINPDTGRPNICRAETRKCPVGGEHYGTKEEARVGYEKLKQQSSEHLKPLKKESAAKRFFHSKLGTIDDNFVNEISPYGCGECGERISNDKAVRLTYSEAISCSKCGNGNIYINGGSVFVVVKDEYEGLLKNPSKAKEQTWFHATTKSLDWLDEVREKNVPVYVGGIEAAVDRVLESYDKNIAESKNPIGEGSNQTLCFFEVTFDSDTEFSKDVFKDDPKLDAVFDFGRNGSNDACLYVNEWEGPGSVSIFTKPDKLKVVRIIEAKPEDLWEVRSIYNIS